MNYYDWLKSVKTTDTVIIKSQKGVMRTGLITALTDDLILVGFNQSFEINSGYSTDGKDDQIIPLTDEGIQKIEKSTLVKRIKKIDWNEVSNGKLREILAILNT